MYEYWDHIQNKVLVVFFLTIYSQLIKKKMNFQFDFNLFLLAFLILRIKSKFEIIVLC